MKVSALGEFGLIERITASGLHREPPDLLVGIGDDAAVWRMGGELVVATIDALIAGVHFLPDRTPWEAAGRKALAVNLSDIAAMGARPQFALVSLALPPDTEVSAAEQIYAGLYSEAERHGVAIAGGDTVRAGEVSVTVAVIGRAGRDERGEPLVLRRNAARPGDLIAVTGPLGDSAGGLRRLREGAGADDELVRAHLNPVPRLALGAAAVAVGVRCGIDVSDGLVQDLGHVCRASGAGAVVRAEDIPLSAALSAAYPGEALRLACTGGEDYQLLLVGPRAAIEALRQHPDAASVSVIGEIVDSYDRTVTVIGGDGKAVDVGRPGWDAFQP